jgi:hypothetical protein
LPSPAGHGDPPARVGPAQPLHPIPAPHARDFFQFNIQNWKFETSIENRQSAVENSSVRAAGEFPHDVADKALGVAEEHEGFLFLWDQSGTTGLAINIPDREHLSQSTHLSFEIFPNGNK